MAVEYRDEQNRKAEEKIRRVLDAAPSYMRRFYQHISGGTKEVLTQLYYISDVVDFMKFEKEIVPSLADTPGDRRVRVIAYSRTPRFYAAFGGFLCSLAPFWPQIFRQIQGRFPPNPFCICRENDVVQKSNNRHLNKCKHCMNENGGSRVTVISCYSGAWSYLLIPYGIAFLSSVRV